MGNGGRADGGTRRLTTRMTYAAMVETAPGTAQVVLGMEQPHGTSDLYTADITVE